MTLRQLEYVLAVAELRSFTKAAERLHVSQPSLSQQVQSLEVQVGGRLFDRPPKPVRLTSAGRAFVAEARVAVTSAGRALDAARRVIDLEPESITVATVQSLSASLLPDCLLRWHERNGRLAVHLREYAHRNQVQDAVRERSAELGIGPAPHEWLGAVEHLGWEELVVVLPVGDALLQSPGPVPLEALADRNWVLFDESHGLAEGARRACAAAGFEPQCVLRTTQVESAARLAASGLGVALIPFANVPESIAAAARRLDPPVVWELAAFASTPRFGAVSQAFIDTVADGDWLRRRPRGARVLDLGDTGR